MDIVPISVVFTLSVNNIAQFERNLLGWPWLAKAQKRKERILNSVFNNLLTNMSHNCSHYTIIHDLKFQKGLKMELQ